MTRPSIGTLRHRVTLESAVRTTDGGGGAITSWIVVADLWGALAPTDGREVVAAETIGGQVSHVLHIRYRPGITPAMRFRFGQRLFEIIAVMDTGERARFLKCLLRERGL